MSSAALPMPRPMPSVASADGDAACGADPVGFAAAFQSLDDVSGRLPKIKLVTFDIIARYTRLMPPSMPFVTTHSTTKHI
jgi:hypothetical protein